MSFQEENEADEETPRNPKLKVHRDEKNRRDRKHSGVAPRAETVRASVEKQDVGDQEGESSMETKRSSRKGAVRRRVKRKSAVYAAMVKSQLPPLRLSMLRPRRLSKERVWILATLAGATAVFLLMLLQMAQSQARLNAESAPQEEEVIRVASPEPTAYAEATELTQAELDQKRLDRFAEMSQPAPETIEEKHELTFLERLELLRERPFLRKKMSIPDEEEVVIKVPDPIPLPAKTPPTQEDPFDVPPATNANVASEPAIDFNVDVANSAKRPETKAVDPFLDAPETKPDAEPPKNENPFAISEPAEKSQERIELPPPDPIQPERKITETAAPEIAAQPEPVVPSEKTHAFEPEPIQPAKPEPEPPQIVNTPPDVDLNINVERLSRTRPKRPVEDEGDQFLVRSDAADSKPAPTLIVPEKRDDNWTESKPESKRSLINPNLSRERKPTWRIVAPVAEIGDPANISSSDTHQKELNISVIKTSPRESSVQQMFTYEIIVRNESSQSVDGLIIEEHVPETMRVADVIPKATFEDQTLQWLLSAIGPHEERKLEVNLIALKDGATQSRTIAHPVAAVATETQVDAAKLRLEVTSAPQISNGKLCPITFRITNLSAIAVEGVTLHADLPEEFSHDKGSSLNLPIEKLEPGETHVARLNPRAENLGAAIMPAELRIGENQVATAEAKVRIVKGQVKTANSSGTPRGKASAPNPCNCNPCCR